MTPEKIDKVADNWLKKNYGKYKPSEHKAFTEAYDMCQKNILESLELHIQINEHDWNRNPQAQLKDFIQSLNK